MRSRFLKTAVWTIVSGFTMTLGAGAAERTTLGGPLKLRDQGSFYVNGAVTTNAPNSEIIVNQNNLKIADRIIGWLRDKVR